MPNAIQRGMIFTFRHTVSATALLLLPLLGLAQSSTYDLTSINGVYTIRMSGVAYEPDGTQDLIVEIGELTADGAGNVSASSTLSLNGSIIRRTFSGTYSVNSDGTGAMTLYPNWGPPINVDTVIGSAGREVTFVLTDDSNVLSGALQAQVLLQPASPAPAYDVTFLTGGYDFSISGFAYDSRGVASPMTEVGRLAFDGNGGITGSDSVSLGFLVRRTLTGSYSLNTNGTGSMVLYPSWGPPIHADLVASGKGARVDFVLTDPTNILSGTLKAQVIPVK